MSFVVIEILKISTMKRFQMTINHAEIKRNAIAKAKELAGGNVDVAIKLAKKFYKQLLEQAMCPIVDCKKLQGAA